MEKKKDYFFKSNNKGEKKHFKAVNGETSNKKEKIIDNNRPGLSNNADTENVKKPFDKKNYRLKKYSKKYKLEQWEEQRKKRLLHEYQKSMKNDDVPGTYVPKSFDEDTTDFGQTGRFVRHPDLIEKDSEKNLKKVKNVYFAKAKEQFNKLKEEKLQKQQEREKAKEERMQKLQEYKKKKQERFKKLSKKTKKGQPVMSGRMEILLEKIKESK